MFIESQKRKLDSEKRELKKAQATYSPRDDQAVSFFRFITGFCQPMGTACQLHCMSITLHVI